MPDGATIANYLSRVSSGDTLSLASNGAYGDSSGFSALLGGTAARKTTVLGNGATITGGTHGVNLSSKSFFRFESITFDDQTTEGVALTGVDDVELVNINIKSDVNPGVYLDCYKIKNCDRVNIDGGTVGPANGANTCDGVEFWGPCNNCTIDDVTVTGLTGGGTPDHHGFEAYGESALEICDDIVFTNCHAESLDVGFSCEGGASSNAIHTNVKAITCTATSMNDFDAQGIQGATLYVTAGTLASRNGNVTEL